MSLLTTVVKICDGVTKSLKFQTKVTYRRWLDNENEYGDERLNPPKKLYAVLEYKQKSVATASGQETLINGTSVLFIDLPALMAATNNQGVGVNDSIVLPDGKTGPILALDGFVDPVVGVGKPVYTQVFIGG